MAIGGSWQAPPIAMTGLALLTYLSHGETPASEEFGPTVEKAIKYLLKTQGKDGTWTGNTYQHGIACYAMSEAFAMTKIMAPRPRRSCAISASRAGASAAPAACSSASSASGWP